MSLEVWGDEGDVGIDGYVTEETAEEKFVEGLVAMRELLARFMEEGGNQAIADSLRANWNPPWGNDPGRPKNIQMGPWD